LNLNLKVAIKYIAFIEFFFIIFQSLPNLNSLALFQPHRFARTQSQVNKQNTYDFETFLNSYLGWFERVNSWLRLPNNLDAFTPYMGLGSRGSVLFK